MTNKITLEIMERSAIADGLTFGESGAYERLRGRAHHAVDPAAAAQAGIVDLENAPTNKDGLVEFAADFLMLRPTDLKKGNKRIFYDFGNRGNMRALQFLNDATYSNTPDTMAHAGNGFLFRRGYTFVWSAWQGDIFPGNNRATLDVPIATQNGKPITGLNRVEFRPNQSGTVCYPLSGWTATESYPTVSLNTSKAKLTKRRYAESERFPIANDAWEFARVEGGAGLDDAETETAIIPSDTHIYLHDGFEAGWLYELIYTAKNPRVLGLGFTAVRDLISFFKYGNKDSAGTQNPASEGITVEKAYGWGRSQTGRVIRDYLYQGFNADAEGRKVFDGLMPHVAGAGMMWMNHRFANLNGTAGQQYEDHLNIADRFPFTYGDSTDHITGKTDALLKHPDTDPLVFHSQTGTEYWQRHGSLVHTDTQGNDVELPENVRVYAMVSSQHFANPKQGKPAKGIMQNVNNVVNTSMFFRAFLDAMDSWSTKGTPPPASCMPTRKDGTLVSYDDWREQFPTIPGQQIPWAANNLPLYDFGPDTDDGFITKQPPEIADQKGYTILVPAVDEDGNDIGGLRAPMVSAPLATYCGWNLRARGHGHGAMFEFNGSTIPFAITSIEREASDDPRPSVQERYKDNDGFAKAVKAASQKLVDDGYMLAEDFERVVESARTWFHPRHDIDL